MPSIETRRNQLRSASDAAIEAIENMRDDLGSLAGHSKGYEYCIYCETNLGSQPVKHSPSCAIFKLEQALQTSARVQGAE